MTDNPVKPQEELKSYLHSYSLNGDGTAATVDVATIAQNDPRLIWLHLNGRHPDTRKYLRDHLQLDHVIVKMLLAEETRPRYEDIGDNTLIILRGINFNPGPGREDLVSIRLWISPTGIVSIGRRKSRAIADLDARLHKKAGPRTVGEFLAMLFNALADSIEPSIAELEEKIEKLEDKSLENPEPSMRADIAAARKEVTLFRRHLSPQRDVLSQLQHAEKPWLSRMDKLSLQDNYDRTTRFIEDLDALRARSEILHDELSNALATRLNRNLHLLSIITVIFMPLTFITGLLGMNVAGIPHAGSPHAFWVVCAISLFIIVFQVALYRRLKWF